MIYFFLSRNIRTARERAWDQTIASRGKGADFWRPYVEEWDHPPLVKPGKWGWSRFMSGPVGSIVAKCGYIRVVQSRMLEGDSKLIYAGDSDCSPAEFHPACGNDHRRVVQSSGDGTVPARACEHSDNHTGHLRLMSQIVLQVEGHDPGSDRHVH